LHRPGIVRLEHLKERGCGHAADCELLRAIQEAAAVDPAVHVVVEQVDELLREIRRLLSSDRLLFK
jgi:hypothetical protein